MKTDERIAEIHERTKALPKIETSVAMLCRDVGKLNKDYYGNGTPGTKMMIDRHEQRLAAIIKEREEEKEDKRTSRNRSSDRKFNLFLRLLVYGISLLSTAAATACTVMFDLLGLGL